MSSPYLLVVILVVASAFALVVLVTAYRHGSGTTGIDAAKIHHLRLETPASR